MHFTWDTDDTTSESAVDSLVRKRNLGSEYTNSDLSLLPDESLLKDIDIAVKRIFDAIRNDEKIIIFGHDDPDGITSTYIIYDYLKSLGATELSYYIPNREKEHHGIQKGFINYVKKGNHKLIVTVDNGISSIDGVKKLRDMACDVIITDHHMLKEEGAPHCYAVVNPKQEECNYPFDMIAGVGLSYLLTRYIYNYCKHHAIIAEEPPLKYVFWAAVGSITDKVPLVDVNRRIVKHAIDNFEKIRDTHIENLRLAYGTVNNQQQALEFITYTGLLLNNGRDLNGNHVGMDYLLAEGDEIDPVLNELIQLKSENDKRVKAVTEYVDMLISGYEGEGFIYFDEADSIPYPLLGLAASHTCFNLKIPAIFLKRKGDDIVCEGRCGPGFSVLEAFSYCSDTLHQFGGHVKAAGFTMAPENLNEFIFQFNGFLEMSKDSIDENKILQIDVAIEIKDLNNDFWERLQELQPYGMGNPVPILSINADKGQLKSVGFKLTGVKLPTTNKKIAFQWIKRKTLNIIDYS